MVDDDPNLSKLNPNHSSFGNVQNAIGALISDTNWFSYDQCILVVKII